jgi:hypothetical protein
MLSFVLAPDGQLTRSANSLPTAMLRNVNKLTGILAVGFPVVYDMGVPNREANGRFHLPERPTRHAGASRC